MAYTPGYKYDIFISYARDDNKTLPREDKGWVTEFKETLETRLIHFRHMKGLKIWFDDKDLDGNHDFDAEIQQGINNSALFFILNSRNYLASEYCRKELKWFLESNINKAGGIMVGNRMRPFNILLNNIHHTEWPEILREKMCFNFHDAPEKSEEFGGMLEIGSDPFKLKNNELVKSTFETLESLKTQNPILSSPNEIPMSETQTKPSIFMADVSETLKPFRTKLSNEISSTANVLDILPPPYGKAQHQQNLDQSLKKASMSIHLFNQWPGASIEGDTGNTFPRVQADTARQLKHTTILWCPKTLNNDDFEDESQLAWLKNAEEQERPHNKFHFVRSTRQELITQVKQMLILLDQQSPTTNIKERFIIDTHQKDQEHAYKLAALLTERGLDVDLKKESDEPTDNIETFEKAMREAQHFIITFGIVTTDWIKQRIQFAVQATVGLMLKEKESAVIWIFMPPGFNNYDQLPKVPASIKINYLLCDSDHLETDSLRPLLDYNEETSR